MLTQKQKKEEFIKRLRAKTVYVIVEKGIEYQYSLATALCLSVWAKDKISKKIKPLFTDFYNQLSEEERAGITVSVYDPDLDPAANRRNYQ